ncbi:MAG: hypothetical protein CL981_06805, partial [Euryarchaeota archaeon]|nr:hypothetical protein [Euryarchaeota archaeon]
AMLLIGIIALISVTIAVVFYIRIKAEQPNDALSLYDSVTEYSVPITAPSADMFSGGMPPPIYSDEDIEYQIKEQD